MAAGALWLPMRTESKSSTSRVMTDEKDKPLGMAREPFACANPSRVRTRSPLFCWARPEPKAKRNHQAPERGTEFRHKSLLNSPIQQISSALWWIHCCFMLPVSSSGRAVGWNGSCDCVATFEVKESPDGPLVANIFWISPVQRAMVRRTRLKCGIRLRIFTMSSQLKLCGSGWKCHTCT